MNGGDSSALESWHREFLLRIESLIHVLYFKILTGRTSVIRKDIFPYIKNAVCFSCEIVD